MSMHVLTLGTQWLKGEYKGSEYLLAQLVQWVTLLNVVVSLKSIHLGYGIFWNLKFGLCTR